MIGSKSCRGGDVYSIDFNEMKNMMICTLCGSEGSTKKVFPGSWVIELLLLPFFILPALIYSFWRRSAAYEVCRMCDSVNVVPLESRAGQNLKARFNH